MLDTRNRMGKQGERRKARRIEERGGKQGQMRGEGEGADKKTENGERLKH